MIDTDDNDWDGTTDTQPTEAPAGASPQPQPDEESAQDQILSALPKESATAILKEVHRFGVRDDDPLWVAILTVLHAEALVASARTAAGQVEAATAKVGPMIYEQALKASADLKGTIDADIRKNAVDVGRKIVTAIEASMGKGVEKVTEAIADLDRIGKEKGDAFVASWRTQAARAAESHADAALQKAIALRWGVVLGTILFSLAAGAILMWEGADLTGHLLPLADHLITIKGRAYCGTFHGLTFRVCGVN